MSSRYQKELLKLKNRHGGLLRAPDVVDAARPLHSPLHEHFEWDDSVAGERFRLVQAQQLIRAVITIIPRADGEPVSARAWISLPNDRADGGGYRETVDVLQDADLLEQAFKSLQEDLSRLRQKYRAFTELAAVLDEMEAAAAAAPPPQPPAKPRRRTKTAQARRVMPRGRQGPDTECASFAIRRMIVECRTITTEELRSVADRAGFDGIPDSTLRTLIGDVCATLAAAEQCGWRQFKPWEPAAPPRGRRTASTQRGVK